MTISFASETSMYALRALVPLQIPLTKAGLPELIELQKPWIFSVWLKLNELDFIKSHIVHVTVRFYGKYAHRNVPLIRVKFPIPEKSTHCDRTVTVMFIDNHQKHHTVCVHVEHSTDELMQLVNTDVIQFSQLIERALVVKMREGSPLLERVTQLLQTFDR